MHKLNLATVNRFKCYSVFNNLIFFLNLRWWNDKNIKKTYLGKIKYEGQKSLTTKANGVR